MEEIGAVDDHQRVRHLIKKMQELAVRYAASFREKIMGKVGALQIFHGVIRRVVLIEKFIDADDIGVPVEAGDHLRFFVKLPRAALKFLSLFAGDRGDTGTAGDSARQCRGIIFLDGDSAVERQVVSEIRDAEAAHAEDLADDVFAELPYGSVRVVPF